MPELRARLERVRATPPNSEYSDGGGNVSGLIGKRRTAVKNDLGIPDECFLADAVGAVEALLAHAQDPDACDRAHEWTYAFYRLPRRTKGGGGPELHLHFDARGRCERADWAWELGE